MSMFITRLSSASRRWHMCETHRLWWKAIFCSSPSLRSIRGAMDNNQELFEYTSGRWL